MATSAGATRPADQITFAHNSERQFARLLDFYRVDWEYEPTAFPIDWDAAGQPIQHFRPDFYLPGWRLYIEITTLNQRLVTKKNRKVRRLRELYPDVRIKVLYQRDYLSLLAKYGLEPPSQMVPMGKVHPPEQLGGPAGRAREGTEEARGEVGAADEPGQGRGELAGVAGPGSGTPIRAGERMRERPRGAAERPRERPDAVAERPHARPGGAVERPDARPGGAVERVAGAGRPRVVPDPPGLVPPLPVDPELVRLAQVLLPAEIAQRRGPAAAKRAG